jgi:hypothetical protein
VFDLYILACGIGLPFAYGVIPDNVIIGAADKKNGNGLLRSANDGLVIGVEGDILIYLTLLKNMGWMKKFTLAMKRICRSNS